jgi:exodeoxyribonuclease III
MKIVSWNVNGIRACIKKDFYGSFDQLEPDIIGLQEVKCHPLKMERPAYHTYWNEAQKKGYSGTAVLTKIKPNNVTYGLGSFLEDTEGRVITLEFDDFFFVTVYTPNSKRGLLRLPYRIEEWDVAFLNHINFLNESKPTILCGDLNVAHKEIDLARPKNNKKSAGFTEQERNSFSKLLDAGYIDTFRELNPEPGHYSWWSYFANSRAKNIGWRIDYVCSSTSLRPKLRDAKIHPAILGSDHCPVSATFDL